MSTAIEANRASLSTLAVTIQALHVNGKQMTLAVFRQLPIAEETSESSLWGVVRYSIKDEGDLWLVFSSLGMLFRRALLTELPCKEYVKRNFFVRAEDAKKCLDKTLGYLEQRPDDAFWSKELPNDRLKAESADAELQEQVQLVEEANACARLIFERDTRLSKLNQLFIAV